LCSQILPVHSPLSKQNNTLQTYVKKAIKMEEAEELKTKLEAAGATVEIV
jgi:ribosomal protein L7/L12